MKSALLIFANQPLPVLVPGAASGCEPDALALALLKDTLRNLADVDADVFLFLEPGPDPGPDKDQMKDRAKALLGKALMGKGRLKIAHALGRNRTVQQRNAFRLVFARGYDRALLLDNATPDLPAHAVESALATLKWKDACLGPVPIPDQDPDSIYALGFHAEGWMTEAFDQVERNRPGLFRRLETLMLFYARNVHVLPPYAPVASLDDCPALVRRCRDTRFALLPSLRLAAERSA